MKKKTEKLKAYSFETLTSPSTMKKEMMKRVKGGGSDPCGPDQPVAGGNG